MKNNEWWVTYGMTSKKNVREGREKKRRNEKLGLRKEKEVPPNWEA